MLKAKTSEKFLSTNLQNFDLLGALKIRGSEKLRFLLQKYHPCVNARRLSHFASKSVRGSDLQGWAGKNSESHARLPQEWCVAVNTGLALPRSLWCCKHKRR